MARLGDATWHPKRMTLGIKGWLTISHVSDDGIREIMK